MAEIKLREDPIQFDGDCIDPYAKAIIAEALEYAMETASSRLKSAGKILREVEITGQPTLGIVQAIRDAILKMPVCERGALIAPAPKPTEAKPPSPKPAKAPPVEEAPPRTLPELWGKAYFEGKEYDNPTTLARERGIKIKGARNMVHAFTRAGFEVTGDGKPAKDKPFKVKRIGPTPLEFKAEAPEKPEVVEKKKEEPYPGKAAKVMDKEGKLIGYRDAKGNWIPKEHWPKILGG